MQHPTITVEHGNLKINDEKVFSLWLRLNEMAADDPVAACPQPRLGSSTESALLYE